jgi:PKD repeat protein/C1A family cysteine protease
MKRGLAIIVALSVLLVFVSWSYAQDSELDQIRQAIEKKGAGWIANETPVSQLPPKERRRKLGAKEPIFSEQFQKMSLPTQLPAETLPSSLDYRVYEYVTPARDQGACGSCWAFAATATLESQVLKNDSSISNTELDLAEQILVSCSGSGNCDGGDPGDASYFIESTGLPSETCFFYTATNNNCSNACQFWQAQTYKINNWRYVTTWTATVDVLKSALYNYGPLISSMTVYTDFFSYSGGVYSYVWGTLEGGHAIELIGYDDDLQCFIAKNSWGPYWGEDGVFQIAYSQIASEVHLGYWTIAYNTPPSAFINISISPPEAVAAGANYVEIDGVSHSITEIVEVSVGELHTVTFPDVPGWKTPESQNVTLASGETRMIFGVYTPPVFVNAGIAVSSAIGEATPRIPFSVGFKDVSTSTEPIVSRVWNFGDGTKSKVKNPSHYFYPGVYQVTLTIKTATETSTATKMITIYRRPVARFFASILKGANPLSVPFIDESVGDVTGWLWDFGDGTTSAEQNPVHTFTLADGINAQRFTVKLTAQGPLSAKTVTKASYIFVYNPPKADFSYAPDPENTLRIRFTDLSTGVINPNRYIWRFGDGKTSLKPNPVHTYKKPGTYTVSLSVRGAGETSVREQTITVP